MKYTLTLPPSPGSKEAIKKGCICPVEDNHHGKGIEVDDAIAFWYNAECKVHRIITQARKLTK